jgi:hypothetical protein
MKVTVTSKSKGYVQINSKVRGEAPIVLGKEGDSKEFATHGEFSSFFDGANAMKVSGLVDVTFEGEKEKDPTVGVKKFGATGVVTTPVEDAVVEPTPVVEEKPVNKFAPKNKLKQQPSANV